MHTLELKVPPVILVFIFSVLMWSCSEWLPGVALSAAVRYPLAVIFFIAGFLLILAGVISFRKARTTMNPVNPETASSLVTAGIYRFTRNPMYAGFLLGLMGWGVFLANLYAVSLIVFFVVYINRFQILPEERVLDEIFPKQYEIYRTEVRRWF